MKQWCVKMDIDDFEYDCDPSGEGCENCPRYMDDCDGKEEMYEEE